jgi:hypothetical protein
VGGYIEDVRLAFGFNHTRNIHYKDLSQYAERTAFLQGRMRRSLQVRPLIHGMAEEWTALRSSQKGLLHPLKDSRKADAVLAPNQNIENNPMQSSMVSLAWMLYPRKHLTRRANQGHYSTIAQFVKRPWPSPTTGSSARLRAKNPDN